MYEHESNYSDITCPFCDINICCHKDYDGAISDLDEDCNEGFFQCPKCEKSFKVELEIYRECNYIIKKPTEEEIKENNLIVDEDVIKDVPGQTFMWKEL